MAKEHYSIDRQVALLRERGMLINDEQSCVNALKSYGYYRLSGYWYQFRKREIVDDVQVTHEDFIPGTTFDYVLAIYEFDRKLKFLIFEMIELFEVSMRFHVGHTLGAVSPHAHMETEIFQADFLELKKTIRFGVETEKSDFETLVQGINRQVDRSSEDFVKHHIDKHQGVFPIWAITELLTFGQLLKLLKGSKEKYQNLIAATLGITTRSGDGQGGALIDWLENLNDVRNVCAHHGRLWNRRLGKPLKLNHLRLTDETKHIDQVQKYLKVLKVNHDFSTKRIYATLVILLYLNDKLQLDAGWPIRLRQHLESLPKPANLFQMGFMFGWEDQEIWARQDNESHTTKNG